MKNIESIGRSSHQSPIYSRFIFFLYTPHFIRLQNVNVRDHFNSHQERNQIY